MKFAVKYALVPQDEYERLKRGNESRKRPLDPFESMERREVKRIHKDMTSLTNDTSVSDEEKNIEFGQLRHKFLSYLNSIGKEPSVKSKNISRSSFVPRLEMGKIKSQMDDKGVKEDASKMKSGEFKALDPFVFVEPANRQRANDLLDRAKDRGFTWDEEGTVTYKGKTISKSNISALLGDTIRGVRRDSPSYAYRVFTEGLKRQDPVRPRTREGLRPDPKKSSKAKGQSGHGVNVENWLTDLK